MDVKLYDQMIGTLLYLTLGSRPDCCKVSDDLLGKAAVRVKKEGWIICRLNAFLKCL